MLFLVLNKANPRQAQFASIVHYWDLYADDDQLRKKLHLAVGVSGIGLLILLPFLASGAAFAFDRHIRVDFFVRKLPPGLRAFVDWLSFAVTASLFAFIAFYAGKLTWDQYRFEETSPALGVPQWWYTVWMPVLAVALVLRLVITRLRRRSPPPEGDARGDARAAQ